MKIKNILSETLITNVVHRLANEALREFGIKYSNPKKVFSAFYDNTDNLIKKDKLSKNKKDIIIAIKELRK